VSRKERTPGAARVAPFALLRVASMPYDDLVALAPPRTIEQLAAADTAGERAERARAPLEEELFRAIGACEDRRARNVAIELRRNIHNGRTVRVTADDLARSGVPCSIALRALLEARREATAAIAHAVDEAERGLREEQEEWIRPRIRALFTSEDFLRPLALAAPQLSRRLLDERTRLPVDSKLQRTLLGYWMRAAAKTSPFSTFMHTGFVTVEGRSGGALELPLVEARESRSYVSSSILSALERAIPGAADASLSWNPTLRWLPEGLVEVLVGRRTSLMGRGWRSERLLRFRAHPALRAAHERLVAFSAGELDASFQNSGLSRDAASQLARLLAKNDVIRRARVLAAFDDPPEHALVAALATREEVPVEPLRELLQSAAKVSKGAATERVALVEKATAACERFASVEELKGLTVVLEDAFFAAPLGDVGSAMSALLQEAADALQPHVYARPAYAYMRAVFLERFGANGRCGDVLRFLSSLNDGLGGPEGPMRRPRERRDPREGPDSVAATALVQVAAADAEALARGEALAVVNQVLPGAGWLSARHAAGDAPGQEALRRSLRAWLRAAHAPLEPVDLSYCGDCNPLQAHPLVTDRVLWWPSEPLGAACPLPLAETELIADERGHLCLVDGDGKGVAPVYLGGTLPHHSWGPVFWLTVLGQRGHVDLFADGMPAPSREPVSHQPRRTVGRVVLDRARWTVQAEVLRRWAGGQGAARLRSFGGERRAHQIPRFFYATRLSLELLASSDARKPLWIDAMNPLCLDMLSALASTSEALSLVEALPDVASTWMRMAGKRHVTEYLLELLL
jgi:hypothetical protein